MKISGFVAPGFGPVVDEFKRNFDERRELGAAFSVARNSELLVDIWGGIADRATGQPWTMNTLQILFSGTKGLVAACMLLLIERGQLSLAKPVADYWPEFAAAGKQDVLVSDVVAHTAGLPGLLTPVTWREAVDARRMAALLAEQPLMADLRATRTYHAITFGWLCGELIRRVDGRSTGQFFAEEIAGPFGLEIWIGLPYELEGRVSTVELAETWGAAVPATGLIEDPLRRAIQNPARFDKENFPWNEPAWHAVEVPSSNGIGTARSVARFYANLNQMLSPGTLQLATTPLSIRHDPLLGRTASFGVGFQLQTTQRVFGPPANAFGHCGAGGSIHGRWPAQQIGFSYVMNRMRDDPDDTRGAALLDALSSCLRESEAKTCR